MTKDEIDKLAATVAEDMRLNYAAIGENLDMAIRMYLMDAIRQTEDEARELAFQCANSIGNKRKQ